MTSSVKSPKGPLPEKILNRLTNGTSTIVFGPLPVKLDFSDSLSTSSLESTIKGFNFTGKRANFSQNHVAGQTINVPNASVNDFASDVLTIEFVADDLLDNYELMHRWLDVVMGLKYRYETNVVQGKGEFWDAQRAWCDYVDIIVGNNMRERIAILRFHHVFCESVGDVTVNFTQSEDIAFQCSFKYNRFEIIRKPTDIESILHDYAN